MLTEVSTMKFVVKVNGVIVSPTLPTRRLAESMILTLPADQQAIAEILTISDQGKELLLG